MSDDLSEQPALLTFGFQTRTGRGPSSICLRRTGCGQVLEGINLLVAVVKIWAYHWYMMMKNLLTIAPARALGYS